MQIHGKEYAEVKDRITEFRKVYPTWSILTDVPYHAMDFSWAVFKATLVSPDGQKFDGWAYEERTEDSKQVNFTSWVENCETSAIGRALANMGLQLSEQRPSAQEMQKVERMTSAPVEVKKLKLRGVTQAGETSEKDKLLQGIMSAKGSIVAMTGHDRAFQQALANRNISSLAEVQTIGTLKELYEGLANFVQYLDDRLQEVGAKKVKDLADTEKIELDIALTKMELML